MIVEPFHKQFLFAAYVVYSEEEWGWSILTVMEADSEQCQHPITKLFTHHFSFLHTCFLHTKKCFYAFKGGTHGIQLFFKCKDEIGSFV